MKNTAKILTASFCILAFTGCQSMANLKNPHHANGYEQFVQKRQKNLRQNPYRYQSAETVVEGVLSVPAAVVYGIMTVFGGVNP
tara:strand:+ start:223 stop:474 length:252 start_codon:yes stop_codon:yes gene_type:complete